MSMYLGVLRFDGDPALLLPAYHRLLERFPVQDLDLHICVVRDGGLTVVDACPSEEIFKEFTGGETFLGAVAATGLPAPSADGLGTVHVAHLREEVRP